MNPLLLLAPRIATNRLWARAGAVPSFHIAPAAQRHARDLITGNLLGTYNSASPAYAVGPDGILALPAANAPVIEYDPVTLQCLGARIWGSVLQRSLSTRDLTQSSVWTTSGITPVRDQVGADGTANTATRLTATASDGTILQQLTSASATHVSGFYVRRITGTGTVEITQNGGTTWTAITLTSAFQRFAVAAATVLNPRIGFRIRSNGDEIAVDFTQCQSASVLGPPVANASTSATASSTADVWSITGSDFTRIYNSQAFTIYANILRGYAGSFVEYDSFYSLSDGTPQNIVPAFGILGNQQVSNFQIASGGVGQTDYVQVALSGSSSVKIIQALASNDSRFGVNGTLTARDTSVTMPVGINRLSIGSDLFGASQCNGYVRELTLFASRRPDANLTAIMS